MVVKESLSPWCHWPSLEVVLGGACIIINVGCSMAEEGLADDDASATGATITIHKNIPPHTTGL